MKRRKSALAVIAVVAVCSVWVGLVASPASASPAVASGDVAESVTVTTSVSAATQGVAATDYICKTHNWYYRIYLRGSGQNLFVWTFSNKYCFFPNRYFFAMGPTDKVTLQHSDIRGSTVRERIITTPRGIEGPLYVLYDGATFQYCPNGTCRQTFTPRLAWIYGLDDTRTYAGLVPLE